MSLKVCLLRIKLFYPSMKMCQVKCIPALTQRLRKPLLSRNKLNHSATLSFLGPRPYVLTLVINTLLAHSFLRLVNTLLPLSFILIFCHLKDWVHPKCLNKKVISKQYELLINFMEWCSFFFHIFLCVFAQ